MRLLEMKPGEKNSQFTVQVKSVHTGEWSNHLENGWRYFDGSLIDAIVERLSRDPDVEEFRVFRHETLRVR